jgi:CheY-specific phosphatase CheX
MTFEMDIETFAGTDPVYVIASEVFAAMVDGEPGHVGLWEGPEPVPVEELHAWVDVAGPMGGRVLLTTERSTAVELTRALLGLGADDAVGDADIVDALGEVANVVGGNVKALVPDPGALTLPEVAGTRPETHPDDLIHALSLDWRGRPLTVSLWRLGQEEMIR